MAEACGSRTHPSRSSRDADGFEVREGHRAPCASGADYLSGFRRRKRRDDGVGDLARAEAVGMAVVGDQVRRVDIDDHVGQIVEQ